jgi:3-hydroxyisobutyrate dehydrogenase-like beta-hydroxyacid dehydrogenase
MARNISQKAGLTTPLTVYNRTAQRSHDFAASLPNPSSVKVVESVEEAVSSADIIFTSLGDDASVRGIYAAALKIPGSIKGKLFVETSTVLPETTNEVAQKAAEAGAGFVACPGMLSTPILQLALCNWLLELINGQYSAHPWLPTLAASSPSPLALPR